MIELNYVAQILLLTLAVTLTSTAISTVGGLPLGYLIAKGRKKAIKPIRSIVTAMTGIPPVVAGLCIYFLLTRNGPFGGFKLLYSPTAMVLAQIIIVLPIIAAIAYPAIMKVDSEISETCTGLRLSTGKTFGLLLSESRPACVGAIMSGFGRAISEVGAVMMVGGNIAWKTRVMTTALLTETGRGNYATAMLLGGVLLLVSISVNLLAGKLRDDK